MSILCYNQKMPKEKRVKVNIDKVKEQQDEIRYTKELEMQLDEDNAKMMELMLYGSCPDLAQLTYENYQKFKAGNLTTYFDDDQEIEEFFKIKKKEIILRLTTFIDAASVAMLNQDKLKASNLSELSKALSTSVAVLSDLMGTKKSPVVHEHKHAVVDKEDLTTDQRIEKARKKLEILDAEYSEITDSDSSEDIDL
jgi:hypothetical protein